MSAWLLHRRRDITKEAMHLQFNSLAPKELIYEKFSSYKFIIFFVLSSLSRESCHRTFVIMRHEAFQHITLIISFFCGWHEDS